MGENKKIKSEDGITSDEKDYIDFEKQQQSAKYQEFQKQRDKNNKKKWLWGCGGCLITFIILCIIFTACTGAFVNEVDKAVNEKGNSSKNKNTEIKQVGETTEIDGVSFTLDNASYTDERNEFSEIQADRVLKIDMTVKNNSDHDIPVGTDIKVYADGKQVKSYPINDTLLDSLSPGRSISGSGGFAINGNPKKIELEFQPLTTFSNKRYIYEINVN